MISAEVLDPQNLLLYKTVMDHMIHGPCGLANRSSPCMKDGKCSRFYPKKFQEKIAISEDGYPHYRRRNNGANIVRNGIELGNRFVVPYNPNLLIKYQAHINVEWCNRSTSIKYLFKYINKGYDRITVAIVSNCTNPSTSEAIDEIKNYVDCKYISPCEKCSRISAFPIHGRNLAVERQFFHLVGEHQIYIRDRDIIDQLIVKPCITESIFTSWMECNKKYP